MECAVESDSREANDGEGRRALSEAGAPELDEPLERAALVQRALELQQTIESCARETQRARHSCADLREHNDALAEHLDGLMASVSKMGRTIVARHDPAANSPPSTAARAVASDAPLSAGVPFVGGLGTPRVFSAGLSGSPRPRPPS